MKFFTHKRSLPAVPIISLIDILAILLIFFIATTTFKKRESLIKVNLPKSSEMEATADKTVRVTIFITEEGEVYLEDQLIPVEELSAAIRVFKINYPDSQFEVQSDGKAEVQQWIKVMDAAKKSGVEIETLPSRVMVERPGN